MDIQGSISRFFIASLGVGLGAVAIWPHIANQAKFCDRVICAYWFS